LFIGLQFDAGSRQTAIGLERSGPTESLPKVRRAQIPRSGYDPVISWLETDELISALCVSQRFELSRFGAR
jgi:hypothetical protein